MLSVNGFNDDGQILSNALDIQYKSYTEALEQILNHDSIAALLSNDEIMTITVIGPDEQQSASILSGVERCAAERSNTYCYFARPEEVSAAHEAGLSCGKYRAFLELQLLDPKMTPEAVQGMTMREIRELISSLSIESEETAVSYGSRGNGYHGPCGRHGNG